MKLRPIDGIVLALAVVVRVAGLSAYDATLFADHPMVDAFTYWTQATQLDALLDDNDVGLLHYWTRPSALEGRDPFAEGFYQPPGYPLFLWAVGQLTGAPDLGVTRWVQAGLGIFSTLALLVLGRRLGTPRGMPWLGAVAAGLCTLYAPTLLFEQDILTPALTTASFLASLWLLWPDAQGRVRTGRAAGAGLLQGLTVVVHPTYLLASAACGLWLLARAWSRSARVSAKERLGPLVALCLALGLALAPTAWRNAAIHQQPALVSHNSGVNFYLGNNAAWRDTMFLRPGLPWRRFVLEAEPHKRQVHQRNDYWWERARAEIRDKPVVWGATLMTKALWSVHDREIPRNEDYRCRTDEGPMAWLAWLPVRYGLVLPFAVLGMGGLLRRPGPGRLVVLSWAMLHAPLVLFIVADRYRLATFPLVALAAAMGIGMVVHAVRTWRSEGRGPPRWWLVVLPFLALPWVPLDERTAYDEAWCLHVEGNLALMAGEDERGAQLYEDALALDPEDWGARDFLARTRYKQGRPDQAAELMEPLVAWFPDHYPTLYFMGRLEARRGRDDQAADYMGRAYRVPGERTNTGVRYVRMLVEAGREAEARAVVAADEALQGHPRLEGVLD